MKKLILVLACSILLSSCYSVKYTYTGNYHQNSIGKSKNEILRTYGVPERTMDDGNNGTILIFENFTQTTISTANSASYGKSIQNNAAVYGNGGILGVSQTKSGQVSSTNSISQTSISKTFCYLYVNSENIVYDFKSNFGAKYTTSRCLSKKDSWLGVTLGGFLFFPSIIVTIPVTASKIKKAKNNNMLCED